MHTIPDRYRPISGSEAINPAAIEQQLQLAQAAYDPHGVFAERRDMSWMFTLTRDTSGLDIPAMYKTAATRLTALVVADEQSVDIGVSIMVATPDGAEHTYSAGSEEEMPVALALLGNIACMELAELETRPWNALGALAQFEPTTYSVFERLIAQKTFDPERTETGAVHLRYFKLGNLQAGNASTEYRLHYGRPITIDGSDFVYWQQIIDDPNGEPVFYHLPHAALYTRPYPLGEQYGADMYGFGLQDDERLRAWIRANKPGGDKEIAFSAFEQRLQAAGNLYVGDLTGEDASRIISEPLTADHRLHIH